VLVLALQILDYNADAGFGMSLLIQGCFVLSSTLVGAPLYLAGGPDWRRAPARR
jgi:hypothetical protein